MRRHCYTINCKITELEKNDITVKALRACLKTPCSAAAVDFGGGQGGEAARIPAAGFDGRANTGVRQKTRRPQGFFLIILAHFSRFLINRIHWYAIFFQFGCALVNVLKTALHAVFRQLLKRHEAAPAEFLLRD